MQGSEIRGFFLTTYSYFHCFSCHIHFMTGNDARYLYQFHLHKGSDMHNI